MWSCFVSGPSWMEKPQGETWWDDWRVQKNAGGFKGMDVLNIWVHFIEFLQILEVKVQNFYYSIFNSKDTCTHSTQWKTKFETLSIFVHRLSLNKNLPMQYYQITNFIILFLGGGVYVLWRIYFQFYVLQLYRKHLKASKPLDSYLSEIGNGISGQGYLDYECEPCNSNSRRSER